MKSIVSMFLVLATSMLSIVQASGTTAKPPIFTEVQPGGSCPNGAWSVVEDVNGDGCYDHVQGRNCAGEVVDEPYSDQNCMTVPHDMGPFSGSVTGGAFTNSSSYWEITLTKNGLVKGYMRLVNGVVSIQWVTSSIVERPIPQPSPVGNPQNGGDLSRKNVTSTVDGLQATSVTSGAISDKELAAVHSSMADMLIGNKHYKTQELAPSSLAVHAIGTALGSPTALSIESTVAGEAKVEIVNLTSVNRTLLAATPIAAGTTRIEPQLDNLPAGAYMILVTVAGIQASTSFVVAR